ncbi:MULTISPECIES: Flp pilus assembly protein CpaB [Paraburkholderia]|uniref:Flp pilus assembly protein CpaB n=1 Tax=Paraburkholderia TaxID=1822464 RepID=UPI00225B6026|nr:MULTISPECIES: Flp pilus assembly protein CpaB [Paraburkholderia]MCX4164439.1 Flp pilus assembly protein CpaB [Paraburkholderia megapolitana]MDN7159932.1 Flp pilus assembly protein CpaB [Paraburkholderia sp. CHISQ3]MDQ6496979.1 Flp pilus assembly protein CpaB [Paraburkholderia megapolitana]
MMPKITRIVAGALIVLALLLGVFAWMLSRRPPPAPPASIAQTSFPVVVATHLLAAGKPITADALRIQSLPINPTGAFSDPSLLAGRIPASDIGPDSPVLESQLSSGMAEQITPGERALAVRVDEGNAVGNRLRPGNLVDVFFTLRRDGASGGAEVDTTQARLLLSKVRVLAFGNATAGNDNGSDPNGMVRTAVLAIPVSEVDRVTLAETSGRLIFALRNPRDDETVDPSAFPPLPEVIKTAALAKGASASDSTRAAAGIALDALSGVGGGRAIAPVRVSGPVARVQHSGGGIEVIRGGRTETVAQ